MIIIPVPIRTKNVYDEWVSLNMIYIYKYKYGSINRVFPQELTVKISNPTRCGVSHHSYVPCVPNAGDFLERIRCALATGLGCCIGG